MARFGMPWQGSKSRIAEWVVDVLPPSHTLVDLFAGGCAVTHAALLSGKWQRIIANDKTDSVAVFIDAINGEFDGYATVPTREEFMASEDTALRLLYSFGNSKTAYLWPPELEAVKVPASRMVSAPSAYERRKEYMKFCKALSAYLRGGNPEESAQKVARAKAHGLQELEGAYRLERIQKLHGIEGQERLQGLQADYRLVDVPEGATVYADPPYRDTDIKAYGTFDFEAFDAWLGGVDYPVFVSEYTAPTGCVEIASIGRTGTMRTDNNNKVIERIFVQERFADMCKPLTLF